MVRGDELDANVIREDASRFYRRFPAWGRYGVSAFVAGNLAEVEALCETKLAPWAVVVVIELRSLEEAGIEVIPTFRTPHVTLAHARLDDLARKLLGCEHRIVINPYHEPEVGPLEAQ